MVTCIYISAPPPHFDSSPPFVSEPLACLAMRVCWGLSALRSIDDGTHAVRWLVHVASQATRMTEPLLSSPLTHDGEEGERRGARAHTLTR